jgi:hypothetical protein
MENPSTRNLSALPGIEDLARLSKALAMLDAILSPEWEYRYYSFNSNWGPGEMMASMRNGSGDEYFILFDEHGAAIKGFDHEAVMSPWVSDAAAVWPGIYDAVPEAFSSFLNEPAFSMGDATFCVWRRHGDSSWNCGVTEFPPGEDPDGSEWMLGILDGDPVTYQEFARDYYEAEVPLHAVEHVYGLQPLTDDIIRSLNGELTVESLAAAAVEIGYPLNPV